MKKNKGFVLWQILYPIGIYYVVSSLVFFFLQFMIVSTAETYMLRQLICGAVTIPFVYTFYKQDQRTRDVVFGKNDKQPVVVWLKEILLAAGATAALGAAVNDIIAMTPLMQTSTGFQEANESFFAGSMLLELLGSCLVIPIAEELLFRGVVYQRCKMFWGMKTGIIISALLFGIVHANLVQFIYATLLGLLLALLIEKTGKLSMAVIGHMAANTVAVVRAETGWLDFAYEPTVTGIAFTLVMAGIAGILIWYMIREMQKERA